MRIAYILFDGITLLDFIGVYDPISRIKAKGFMKDLAWDLCATKYDNIITGGAVASSLDVGLYICEKLVGKANTEEIRRSMDYYPGKLEVSTY